MGISRIRLAGVGVAAAAMLVARIVVADGPTTVNVVLSDMPSPLGQTMPGLQGLLGQGLLGQHKTQGERMMGPDGMPGQQWVPGRRWLPGPHGKPWNHELPERQGMPGQLGMYGLSRMSISLDKSTIKAGDVHFVVTNISKSVPHGMLIVAVVDAATALPYDQASARVPEAQIQVRDEVGELAPEKVGTLDLKLTPGTYLLICNVAGHFAAGMVATLTVSPEHPMPGQH